MSVNKEVIIIGSGLSGSVIARELADSGCFVKIIEKRNHIGGNLFDIIDSETGILFHKYGPHFFHTNNRNIYEYFSKYTDVVPFYVKCTSIICGKEVSCPFNFETIDLFYKKSEGQKLKQKLLYYFGTETTILKLLESKDKDIKRYGEFLFKQDYKPYTMKQWGLSPDQVDKSVLKRVPVYFSYNDNYFTDEYQCIPKTSYNDFFSNLLNHDNIKIFKNTNGLSKLLFKGNKVFYDGREVILVYTGTIDSLFNYKLGILPYRSLKFRIYKRSFSSFQKGIVCATPNMRYKTTRKTDYSKILNNNNKTLVSYEYPIQFQPHKNDEAYYPIKNHDSFYLYEKYVELSKKYSNLFVCGRLGQFQYYNMDQAILNALKVATNIKYKLFKSKKDF